MDYHFLSRLESTSIARKANLILRLRWIIPSPYDDDNRIQPSQRTGGQNGGSILDLAATVKAGTGGFGRRCLGLIDFVLSGRGSNYCLLP
jgi:hypothetical protein